VALFDSIIKNKHFFIDKTIDSFVLCVRFDGDHPLLFDEAARAFNNVFGVKGIRSMFLLVIQVESRKTDEEMKEILYRTSGYRYLKDKINKDIPFCLWDNHNPFQNQKVNFKACSANVEKFYFTQEVFELIQGQIINMKMKNK